MLRAFCRWLLKIWGFKITGNFPVKDKKKLYVVVPHTSNWDFPLGILMKYGYHMDVRYVAKHSLFIFPFGWFFRKTGGIPIDRNKSANYVDAIVEVFDRHDTISIAIAPEGTRKKVDRLKTGFYWIAKKAGIPLILVKFDWANKEVNYSEPFYPGEDFDEDMKSIINHFKNVVGKIPKYSFGYEA